MKERTVDGIKMMVVPIEPLEAIDLGNELVAHLGPGIASAFAVGQAFSPFAALEAIGLTSHAFIGKLSAYLPRLLAGTTVAASNVKYELAKGKDEVNRFLSAHPLALKAVVLFSAEVQFARFFPESVLSAIRTQRESLSAAFSQSISGTGSSTG